MKRRVQSRPWRNCHDVERVTAIFKDPFCCVTYQRNIRDKMRVELGVRTDVAKDMLSVVKLAT